MALTSTLFTGLSGLNVNQTRLNVVGNNIANVNTIAFKSSRALFKPQFYVTDAAGSPPSTDFGGTNPSQRGLGASVAAIQKNFTQGSIEPTGVATDMALDGDGFFVIRGKEQRYSRDGSFTLNSENKLINSSGEYVQGFGVDTQGNIVTGSLTDVHIPLGTLTKAESTTKVALTGNLNAGGNVSTGNSVLMSAAYTLVGGGSVPPDASTLLTNLAQSTTPSAAAFTSGTTITLTPKRGGRDMTPLSFDVTSTSTLGDLSAFIQQATGIDTAAGIAPGAASGAVAPGVTLVPDGTTNTVQIQVSSNYGADNSLTIQTPEVLVSDGSNPMAFTETGTPTGEGQFTTFVAYDSLGNAVSVNMTMVLESKANTGTTWRYYVNSPSDSDAKTFDPTASTHPGSVIATGTIDFDSNGKMITSTAQSGSITRAATGAGTPLNFSLDFSAMTSLAGTTSTLFGSGDGQPMGTLASFSVGLNGVITGQFTNGLTQTLGQVAVATFDNPNGMVDDGGNMYSAGPDSGAAKITGALAQKAGGIRAGSLEQSNVDLSAEFINLIIASTGFSAASRVITTSNQLITELLNTSR